MYLAHTRSSQIIGTCMIVAPDAPDACSPQRIYSDVGSTPLFFLSCWQISARVKRVAQKLEEGEMRTRSQELRKNPSSGRN